MGTWGRAILSDDFARDVYDEFIANYNRGVDRETISQQLIQSSTNEISDTDDGPVFWLALAKAQWDTGPVQTAVLARVEEIVANGEGLDRWEEAGPKQLAKRKTALTDFLGTIQTANPAPRKRKPPKFVKAIFRPGDCLAVHLDDGTYGAAIVLAAHDGFEAYGSNLIGLLKFKSADKPAADVFERREWLLRADDFSRGQPDITWCVKVGFRKVAHMFDVITSTNIRSTDPQEARSYASWDLVRGKVSRQFNKEDEAS
jgi:hypothetical protein